MSDAKAELLTLLKVSKMFFGVASDSKDFVILNSWALLNTTLLQAWGSFLYHKNKLEGLGEDATTRVQNDKNHVHLIAVMNGLKKVRQQKKNILEHLEMKVRPSMQALCQAVPANQHETLQSLVDLDLSSSCDFENDAVYLDAVARACAEYETTVTHAAADALKAAAGFEADGPKSWKASLQNLKKVDIARVIGEIPKKALEEVDGKASRAQTKDFYKAGPLG